MPGREMYVSEGMCRFWVFLSIAKQPSKRAEQKCTPSVECDELVLPRMNQPFWRNLTCLSLSKPRLFSELSWHFWLLPALRWQLCGLKQYPTIVFLPDSYLIQPRAFGILGNNGRQHAEWNVGLEVPSVAFVSVISAWNGALCTQPKLPRLHPEFWVCCAERLRVSQEERRLSASPGLGNRTPAHQREGGFKPSIRLKAVFSF